MSASETIEPSRRAGFDVILGNPPWERVKLQEQEFFAQRDPAIATAANAATRKKAVAALKDSNPTLLKEFEIANRRAEGESHLLRTSDRYPLCGRGDINTYAVFAESMRAALSANGRLGVILPTGVATDDTTRFYFGDLVTKQNLVSLMSFENEAFVFPAVHHAMKFCLLTLSGGRHSEPITFVFYARTFSDLTEEHRRFTLSADEITTLSPNTGTCSVFRSRKDASLALSVYRRIPVLVRDHPRDAKSPNPWGVSFLRMFDMANDSALFASIDESSPPDASADRLLPLLEAKMVDAFDHRASSIVRSVDAKMRQAIGRLTTADQHRDPRYTPVPRYWVRSSEVGKRLDTWPHKGLIGFFDITAATNERTMIAAMLPLTGVGHTMPCILADVAFSQYAALLAMLNSFVFDYLGRQKLGGIHYTFQVLKQVPTLPPEALLAPCPWDCSQPTVDWILPRVLELTYTSFDVADIARDLGYDGSPFRWDSERRAIIRAELDAAFLLLYGLSRDEAAYILDTFTLFKARDEERNGGVYKTKQTILAIYDDMASAVGSGRDWSSPLDPPPGDPRAAHDPDRLPPAPASGPGSRSPTGQSPNQREEPKVNRGGSSSGKRRDGIVDAFLAERDGRSADFVVCSAELNARFLAAARDLGEGGTDAELNRHLLSARKTNRLKDHPTTVGFTLPRQVLPYAFVAEWAARYLQRRMFIDHNEEVSLDDILCDPALATRFDDYAGRIKPGVPPLHWRWAALAFRKTGRRRSLGTTAAFDLRDAARQPLLFDAVPPVAGLYMLTADERPIYVNETRNLHETIIRHAEVGEGELVPPWLLDQFPAADGVRWAALAGVNPDTLHEGRIRVVAIERPWLNLVDTLGAA